MRYTKQVTTSQNKIYLTSNNFTEIKLVWKAVQIERNWTKELNISILTWRKDITVTLGIVFYGWQLHSVSSGFSVEARPINLMFVDRSGEIEGHGRMLACRGQFLPHVGKHYLNVRNKDVIPVPGFALDCRG